MVRRRGWVGLGVLLAVGLGATTAGAALIDFEDAGLVHGSVIDNQFQGPLGVTITAVNNSDGPDLAVVFDSRLTGTRDDDLEGPPTGSWALGNLASDTRLGNLLIIQENAIGCDDIGPDICDEPDDEGSRPAGGAGFITFAFGPGREVTELGFDLVDVEGPEEMGEVIFYTGGVGGTELGSFDFEDFVARDGAVFGDNSANGVAPIVLSEEFAGAVSADTVVIRFGGSGAIDNIRYEVVPEPATAQLVGLALLGVGWRRRVRPGLRAR